MRHDDTVIQLRKINYWIPPGQDKPVRSEEPVNPEILAKNHYELFKNLDSYISKIPAADRKNIFATVGYVPGGNPNERLGKTWSHQDVILFDIDDVEYEDGKPKLAYTKALEAALSVDMSKCVLVATGHGLHVVIKPKFTIEHEQFFENNREHYKAILGRIESEFKKAGLKGHGDPAVFAPKYMVRLPMTINEKPDKLTRKVELLNGNLEEQDFSFADLSGIPEQSEALEIREVAFLKFDKVTVETGCEFLKHAKENPGSLNEPEWYASLSILSRLDPTGKLSHEYAKGHPGYDYDETERKRLQALESAGPRTCDSINNLWGGCAKCPNYKKVRSPILLKSPDFIATEFSGFHNVSARGALIPNYEDLMKFYDKKYSFKTISDFSTVYQWNGTHYEPVSQGLIEAFAQEFFVPACNNQKASEFSGIIHRSNVSKYDWFSESTDGFLNLRNGVLNLKTRELLERSPKYGFRHCLPFDYDPKAVAPIYSKMLDEVVGDPDSISTFLEFIGYAISGSPCVADAILLFYGAGGSGKSTVLEPVEALMTGATSTVKLKQFAKDVHLKQMSHSLLNICEEMPRFAEDDIWELIKDLAQGGKITVDQKYKESLVFRNKCKLVFLGNQLPKGANPNEGFFRRLILIESQKSFTDQNTEDVLIGQRVIETEMSGVLNLILAGYDRFFERGQKFKKPEKSKLLVDRYRTELDSVAQWCEDNLEICDEPTKPDPEMPGWMKVVDRVPMIVMPEARKVYEDWCKTEGEKPAGMKTFSQRVLSWLNKKRSVTKFDVSVTRMDGKMVRCIRNVMVKDS